MRLRRGKAGSVEGADSIPRGVLGSDSTSVPRFPHLHLGRTGAGVGVRGVGGDCKLQAREIGPGDAE